MNLLQAFAREVFPNASVWADPATGDYRVTISVSRKEMAACRVDGYEPMLRRVKQSLTPRQVVRRRLHWGRRRRRR